MILFFFQGIDAIKKSHFKKKFDKKNNLYYYERVESERTKNHQNDDENLALGGIIPFFENERGLNNGLYLELFSTFLNEDYPTFFQRPKRRAKKFNIHKPKTKCYFDRSKVGRTFVSEMMPKLCEALNLSRRYTNCNIRPTTIRELKRAGFEDRAILNLTGQTRIETLR